MCVENEIWFSEIILGRERANLLSNLDKRQNIQENKRRQRDGILLASYAISRM